MSEIQDSVITVALYKFDTLLKKNIDIEGRTVTITGQVNDKMFMNIDSALTLLEQQTSEDKPNEPITVRIMSEGGYTYSAFAIIGRFARSKCPINTEAYGYVMSAATLIFASGKKRSISADCVFMVHQASYNVDGKHKDVVNYVQQANVEEMQMAECMARRSNKDSQYWLKVFKRGMDKYLTASEVVLLGVADEVF